MALTKNLRRTGAAGAQVKRDREQERLAQLEKDVSATVARHGNRFWGLVAQLFAVDPNALGWLKDQGFDVDFSRRWRMDVVFAALEKRIEKVESER